MLLEKGTEVLVKVKVVKMAEDDRPEEEKGYVVITSRGSLAFVQPSDIFCQLSKEEIKWK